VPPLVLAYHAVSPRWEHELSIAPSALEQQVTRLMRRGYRPVSLDDVLAGCPGRSLHVTFDDAFASTVAGLEVVGRLGVPATVFACPLYAKDGRAFDVPELAAQAAAYPDELATLNWAGLKAARESGVEIGSHSVSHAHLTRLSDAELVAELVGSRQTLEDELGVPCRVLAYPYGEHDERVRRAARSAGYSAAFALAGNEARREIFALPRIGVYRGESQLRMVLKTMPLARRSAAIALRALGIRPSS